MSSHRARGDQARAAPPGRAAPGPAGGPRSPPPSPRRPRRWSGQLDDLAAQHRPVDGLAPALVQVAGGSGAEPSWRRSVEHVGDLRPPAGHVELDEPLRGLRQLRGAGPSRPGRGRAAVAPARPRHVQPIPCAGSAPAPGRGRRPVTTTACPASSARALNAGGPARPTGSPGSGQRQRAPGAAAAAQQCRPRARAGPDPRSRPTTTCSGPAARERRQQSVDLRATREDAAQPGRQDRRDREQRGGHGGNVARRRQRRRVG